MLTLRNVMWCGSGVATVFAVLRTIQNGPQGELITALTLIAACVLFVGGGVVDRLDRRKE